MRVNVYRVRINSYGFAVADAFSDDGEAVCFTGDARELHGIGCEILSRRASVRRRGLVLIPEVRARTVRAWRARKEMAS